MKSGVDRWVPLETLSLSQPPPLMAVCFEILSLRPSQILELSCKALLAAFSQKPGWQKSLKSREREKKTKKTTLNLRWSINCCIISRLRFITNYVHISASGAINGGFIQTQRAAQDKGKHAPEWRGQQLVNAVMTAMWEDICLNQLIVLSLYPTPGLQGLSIFYKLIRYSLITFP